MWSADLANLLKFLAETEQAAQESMRGIMTEDMHSETRNNRFSFHSGRLNMLSEVRMEIEKIERDRESER